MYGTIIYFLGFNSSEELDCYLKNNYASFSNDLFLTFFRENDIDLIELILKYNKRKLPTYFIIDSISIENLKYIELLIPHVDLKENFYSPLRYAASNNYCKGLELLIPLSDPKNNRSLALYEACVYGSLDAVKMLLPHSNLKFVLNDLKRETMADKIHIEKSIEIINDYLLKEKFEEELKKEINQSKNKIKRKM